MAAATFALVSALAGTGASAEESPRTLRRPRQALRSASPASDCQRPGPADVEGPQEAWVNSSWSELARLIGGGDERSGDAEAAVADAEDGDEQDGSLTGVWNLSLADQLARRFFLLKSQEGTEADGAERKRYMDKKISIDLGVVRQFAVPLALPSWPGAVPQVAFLFMAMDSLDFEDVWDRFFAGSASSSYSIYVHRALAPAGPLPLARWGAAEVAQVETSWCALVGVEVALLSAALQDARNQQFIFLSHNTVPLKGLDYIYRQLVWNSPGTSKFCFAGPAWHKLATTETIRNELRRQCVFRDFYRALNPRTLKHHQWVVLARDHAATVVKRAAEALRLWRESWEVAAPDITTMGEGCSDESVPATALLHDIQDRGRSTGNTWADLTRIGVEQQCLTYVLWRHCFSETELDHRDPILKDFDIVRKHGKISMLTDRDFDFFKSALKRELNGYPTVFENLTFEYLWKLSGQGFMFARKFVKGIHVEADGHLVPLETALPKLWERVDKDASRRVWTRLSSEGVPRPI